MPVENEYRVIGPPGTGKSSYLADQVQKRTQAWSIANEKPINQCTDVLLASLTKTAAAELRGRGLDLPAGQIGTLHSHAMRALGSPKLCVGAKAISQWNKESPLEHWMSGGSTGDDELSVGLAQYNGDRLMSEYTTNRCRLTPREEWRGSVLEFAERYESWKRLNNMMDYEDLITNAFEQQTDPPGNPSTILGDEQQDSSAADLRLMRYWGSKAQKLILVGDDDQRIFSFRGASEHGISGVEIPPDHEKVLEQSYRVPRAVHAAAMDVIRRIENRKDVVYYPRDANGQVDRMHYSMRQNPYEVVDEIERLLKEPDEKPGTAKAMCLFSCAYQAQPLMYALKSAGIPFWNPYAVERSNFNPLHPSKGVSTLDRVLAYLKNSEACHGEQAATWTWEQFAAWAEMCSADGWLRHGAKTEIKKRASVAASLTMTVEEIEGLISNEDVMLDLAECDLGWLGKHILEPKRGVYDYVVDIVKKLGYTGIVNQPRVVVGTGHCSPPDEKILTTSGEVEISKLDPNKHRLCGYYHKSNILIWGGKGTAESSIRKGTRGYEFTAGSRRYKGDMLTISTERSKTRVTPCHRVRVRFAKDFYKKYVVYLMRRGNWWRIGMCISGAMPYVHGGVNGRLSTEQGDAGWILGIYKNKEECRLAEAFYQAKYGIPGTIFYSQRGRQDSISKFHDSLAEHTAPGVERLFRDTSLEIGSPLYTKKNTNRVRNGYAFETVAANFISGYMEMPVTPIGFSRMSSHIKPDWLVGTVTKKPYDGMVYSLDVKPHEHYVSGGAVVHNSVKGGEAEHVFVCPDLSVSGWESYGNYDTRDSIYRLYYVMLTRARQRLILTAPSCPQAVML